MTLRRAISGWVPIFLLLAAGCGAPEVKHSTLLEAVENGDLNDVRRHLRGGGGRERAR